jgi:RNA polymerase sigma factor (sigma-70 family)
MELSYDNQVTPGASSVINTTPGNDLATWNFFRSGSSEAFSLIYQFHFKNLFNYGKKLTQDICLVEDSIHDVFIDLWSKRENLNDTDSIRFYLYKCLRRKIVKSVSKNTQEVLDENNSLYFSLPVEDEIISKETAKEQSIQLRNNFHKLTRRQREALYLKYYRNLDIQEMVSLLSLDLKSTYNLISKGKVNLRQLLNHKNNRSRIMARFKGQRNYAMTACA